MRLDDLLGIDHSDPTQQLAERLVAADDNLLDQLVELRKSKGLTQRDVADRLGVDQSAIARIESGDRDPHLSTLRRYALAIGAEVEHKVIGFKPRTRTSVRPASVIAWASKHDEEVTVQEWVPYSSVLATASSAHR